MKYILTIEETNALRNYLINLRDSNVLTNADLENLQLSGIDLNTIEIDNLLDKIINAYKAMKDLSATNRHDQELKNTFHKVLFQRRSPLIDIILNLKTEENNKKR